MQSSTIDCRLGPHRPLLLGVVFLCLFWGGQLLAQGQSSPNPRLVAVQDADKTPIDFWGKIVDQNGKPVAGVTVKITVSRMLEDPYSRREPRTLISDAKGLFDLTGEKGLGLVVTVIKDGYSSTGDTSVATLNYFYRAQSHQNSFRRAGKLELFPTKATPTVFVLRQDGH